jgi:hypothetical protein
MCVAGRIGLNLKLPVLDAEGQSLTLERALFGETNGCLLIEVRSEDTDTFENLLAGLPCIHLGKVTGAEQTSAKAEPTGAGAEQSDAETVLEICGVRTTAGEQSPGDADGSLNREIRIRLPVSLLIESWKTWE